MQVRSEPSTPRPFAILLVFAAAVVQSSPTTALFAGFTAACAGSVVPTNATTAVAVRARRMKEVFLIDEFSIVSALEGEGWEKNSAYMVI
jgi:hypothetical protein